MDTAETGRLCKDVEYAAIQIRTLISYQTDVGEILDRFWLLQDSLNRLLNAVDGDRGEPSQSRRVIRRVVVALESQASRRAAIPAVKHACEKINGLLISLERSTQQASAL